MLTFLTSMEQNDDGWVTQTTSLSTASQVMALAIEGWDLRQDALLNSPTITSDHGHSSRRSNVVSHPASGRTSENDTRSSTIATSATHPDTSRIRHPLLPTSSSPTLATLTSSRSSTSRQTTMSHSSIALPVSTSSNVDHPTSATQSLTLAILVGFAVGIVVAVTVVTLFRIGPSQNRGKLRRAHLSPASVTKTIRHISSSIPRAIPRFSMFSLRSQRVEMPAVGDHETQQNDNQASGVYELGGSEDCGRLQRPAPSWQGSRARACGTIA